MAWLRGQCASEATSTSRALHCKWLGFAGKAMEHRLKRWKPSLVSAGQPMQCFISPIRMASRAMRCALEQNFYARAYVRTKSQAFERCSFKCASQAMEQNQMAWLRGQCAPKAWHLNDVASMAWLWPVQSGSLASSPRTARLGSARISTL